MQTIDTSNCLSIGCSSRQAREKARGKSYWLVTRSNCAHVTARECTAETATELACARTEARGITGNSKTPLGLQLSEHCFGSLLAERPSKRPVYVACGGNSRLPVFQVRVG